MSALGRCCRKSLFWLTNKTFQPPLAGPMLGNIDRSKTIIDLRTFLQRLAATETTKTLTFARFSELLNFRLFRQHRSNPEVRARNWEVRSSPVNAHRQPGLSGPFRANIGIDASPQRRL